MARTVRRRNYDYAFEDDIFAPFKAGIVTSIILFGLFVGAIAVGSGLNGSSFNTARTTRVQLNKAFSDKHTATELKTRANSMVQLYKDGVTDQIDNAEYGGNTTKKIVAQLQTVAETGKPLNLDTRHYSWATFRQYLQYAWPCAILLCGIIAFLGYAYECQESYVERYFLVDLPWKQFWPVLYIIVTPIGWPFYLVSWYRMQHAPAPPPEAERRLADGYRYDPDFGPHHLYGGYLDPTEHEEEINAEDIPSTTFNSNEEAAHQRYIELRTTSWRESQTRLARQFQRDIDNATADLRSYGERIRSTQMAQNKARSELAAVKATNYETAEAPDQEYIEGEFKRLLALPGVLGIRPTKTGLALLVRSQIQYMGSDYDGGDWKLSFNSDGSFKTKRLRSGTRPGRGGNYPDYSFSDGSFCYGSRTGTIYDNIQMGQFLHGIEVAINTLNSVNPGDAYKVPFTFRKIKKNRKVQTT